MMFVVPESNKKGSGAPSRLRDLQSMGVRA